MDQSALSSRAVMGMYFARLEQDPLMGWLDGISNLFGSDQASETYAFLGQSPTMREWIGQRQAKGFVSNALVILNKHYESTIEIQKKDARRDKTGQLTARMNEWTDRSQTHWASLISTLLLNGATTVCYDGQYFFDTDHSEGSSGSQSNSVSPIFRRCRLCCMALSLRLPSKKCSSRSSWASLRSSASRTTRASR
jgi:phage major head subunit gpT-like protein